MKKSKFLIKTKIKLRNVKGWVFSLGGLAVILTVIAVFGVVASKQLIKPKAPEELTEAVEAAEVLSETETTTTYYEDIPLDAEVQQHILIECDRLAIRPSIVFAIISYSNYQADAVGSGGKAYGLMQIQPKDHYDRMVQYNCTNLFNPIQNTTVGIDYLFELIQKEKGIVWALMAFNGGEKYANQMVASGQISEYAEAVLNEAERLDTYVLQR